MPKVPLRIEVVRSSIKGLGSMGIASATAAVDSLSLHYSDVTMTIVNNKADMASLIKRNPDLAFLGMNFLPAESEHDHDVWLSDILEQHNIRHTGSGEQAHHLAAHKDLAKRRMISKGLKTSPFHIIDMENKKILKDTGLTFPLFVKPSNKGGGQGIDEQSVVHNEQQLVSKVSQVHTKYQANALVEEFLVGREFSIAVIENLDSDQLSAMPIELIAPKDSNGDRMLSNNVKREDLETMLAVTDPAEHSTLKSFAIDAFRALGAQDYGRIDVRFDQFGIPHFIEANLIPSLIEGYGSFPKAYALNLGLNYDAMLLHIVHLGLKR